MNSLVLQQVTSAAANQLFLITLPSGFICLKTTQLQFHENIPRFGMSVLTE